MPTETRSAFITALVAFSEGRELTAEEKAALAEENERLLGLKRPKEDEPCS